MQRPGYAAVRPLMLGSALPLLVWGSAYPRSRVEEKPKWAVIPFKDSFRGNDGRDYGFRAAKAVYDALAKTKQYDLVSLASVNESIRRLDLLGHLTDPHSLEHLAADLHVSNVLTGRIVGWSVQKAHGSRPASAALLLKATQASTGLLINGAAMVTSVTADRDASQDRLVEAVLGACASKAVAQMKSQVMPSATVVRAGENEAEISGGGRIGFFDGETVAVTRGNVVIATSTVFGTKPESSTIRIVPKTKEVRPGDNVQALFVIISDP